jgi:hypothetical protein
MGIETPVLDDMKTKRFIWFRHIQRVADNRWPKQVLEFPSGQRKTRVRWMKKIQDAVEERGVEDGQQEW